MYDIIYNENIEKVLTVVLQRNHSYYTLTLLIPIMLLTLLAPVGLILPGIGLQLAFKLINSYHCMFISCIILLLKNKLKCSVRAGEKMGFQMGLLFTMMIYVEILEKTVPVFDNVRNSPRLLNFFVVVMVSLALSLAISAITLCLYHVPNHEASNFRRWHAHVSIGIARFFNRITCGCWVIDIPQETLNILTLEEQFKDLTLSFVALRNNITTNHYGLPARLSSHKVN